MKKNHKNILILVIISLILFVLWQMGLNWVYANMLKSITNIFLGLISNFQSILDPKADDPALCLYKILPNGQKEGAYCMELKLYSLAIIFLISWQLLLFFNLKFKVALKTLAINFMIFIIAQVFIFSLLTISLKYEVVKIIYDSLRQSFVIIALILIIKDQMFHLVFSLSQSDIKEK